jgi:hypothetical protein
MIANSMGFFFGSLAFFGQAPKCDVAHTSLAQLGVTLIVGNELHSTGDTMQRSFKLATQAGEPSLDHWGFAVHTAMALMVIVLFTLTFAALEVFLSGDESLSALEAAMAISGPTKPGPTK